MDILVVVDMQNDFINGTLGTAEAVKIVPAVKQKIEGFDGKIFFTRDTHGEDYMTTAEGKKLPVEHCIRGTNGWEISSELDVSRAAEIFDKPTFGSFELANAVVMENCCEPIESVTLIGLCTDICVISNAMLIKAALPEAEIIIDSCCCAGVTPESHNTALAAMKACQITII